MSFIRNICLTVFLLVESAGFSQLTFTVTKTAGSYTLTCDTTSVTLQALSNYSAPPIFIFAGPSNQALSGSTQTITTSGVWTITANAGSITASQTLAISINTAVPTLTLASSPASITCNTPTVLLSGIVNPSNAMVTWVGPGVGLPCTTNICIAGVPGTYTMNVANPINGCEASSTISVGDNRLYPILATPSPFIIMCPNGIVNLSVPVLSSAAGLQFQWATPPGAVVSVSNPPTLTTSTPGSYTLTVTNSLNGCSVKTVVLVYACVGLKELALNSIKLFPNPVGEKLHVQFGGYQERVTVAVYDVYGKAMKVQLLNADGWLDFSDLSSGIYFIRLEAGETGRTLKVIKN